MQKQLNFNQGAVETRFQEFHQANPQVLKTIVFRARQLKRRGRAQGGMKMMFELLRWDHLMAVDSADEPFKLNNNYTAYYARLVEKTAPDLAGFFNHRRSEADVALKGIAA